MKNPNAKLFISVEEAEQIVSVLARVAWSDLLSEMNPKETKKLKLCPNIKWKKMGFENLALSDGQSVTMNINYLYSEDWEKFIYDTIPHELGHVAEYRLYKQLGHSENWKRLSILMGDNGDVFHDYKPPTNKPIKPTLKLYCPCRQYEVTTKQFNNVTKKNKGYICNNCKTHLKPV